MDRLHRRALIALLMLRRREYELQPAGPEDLSSHTTVEVTSWRR